MVYDYQRVLSLRLLAWSILSILFGAVVLTLGSIFWRGFASQALAWGAVDALIAVFGLRAALARLDQPVDLPAVAKDAKRLRTILWVNTGLDILYVAGGWLLATTWSRADPFWVGAGWGIILQGGFLFIFDLLHALAVPQERIMPRLDLFPSPEHAPFTLPGGRGAILMVHGFPHSPAEMRPLAEALNRQGWTTRGMLLPGFGPEFEHLFQQRYPGWVDAILAELRELKKEHAPVILLGFSLGGGLSLLAASKESPDQLVLIAPFWWESTWFKDVILTLARLVMPLHIGLNRNATFRLLRSAKSAGVALQGEVSGDELKETIQHLRVPLVFLEQFLRFSNCLKSAVESVDSPVVMIQGLSDQTVQPRRTRKLASWLPAPVSVIEIPGDHFFIQSGDPNLPGLIETVGDQLVKQKEG